MVAYSEVILGRDLLAGELDICWEIPAPSAKHSIAGPPHPDESDYRNVALLGGSLEFRGGGQRGWSLGSPLTLPAKTRQWAPSGWCHLCARAPTYP